MARRGNLATGDAIDLIITQCHLPRYGSNCQIYPTVAGRLLFRLPTPVPGHRATSTDFYSPQTSHLFRLLHLTIVVNDPTPHRLIRPVAARRMACLGPDQSNSLLLILRRACFDKNRREPPKPPSDKTVAVLHSRGDRPNDLRLEPHLAGKSLQCKVRQPTRHFLVGGLAGAVPTF